MPPYSMPVSPVGGVHRGERGLAGAELAADDAVDVDAGGGEDETRGERGLAAALAGHDHAVRGLFEQLPPVVLDEDGGVGPLGVGVDVQDLLGGDGAAPAAVRRRRPGRTSSSRQSGAGVAVSKCPMGARMTAR